MFLQASQDIEYLEGSITEFPNELAQQIGSYDSKIFSRTLWQQWPWKKQCLDTTYEGRPAKFVLKRDMKMSELKAGRFRCDRNDQIVVVGLPAEGVVGGLRYVIVSRPWSQKDCFNRAIRGTAEWKASAWNVWRPKDRYGKYYKDVPRTILRVQGPASSSGKQDAGIVALFVKKRITTDRHQDKTIPASTQTSLLNLLARGITKQDHAVSEQQPILSTMELAATKRKLSFETDPDQSPKPKRSREEHKERGEPTRMMTTSTTLVAPSDNTGVQDPLSTNDALPPTDQLKVSKQKLAYRTALEETFYPVSTNIEMTEKTHGPTLQGAALTSLLPPHIDTSRDDDDADQALAVVKQEGAGIETITSFQISHSDREILSTTVPSISQGGNFRSMSVPTRLPPHKEASASSSVLTSTAFRQSGARDVIDLTEDDDRDTIQQIPTRQIDVMFINGYGQKQHTMPFQECNTGADMFEEACVWDVADKDTKLLEIKIAGFEAVRVRTNNEKHFAQKVFGPVKNFASRLAEGQLITLTVQKYM